MAVKAIARYLYANVPGVAKVRFATKDRTAAIFSKPEYKGTRYLSLGRGLIVDVGANRGQSIAAFRAMAPEARVVAFEPEPKSAARLAARFHSDPNVIIENCALGEAPGEITFYVPKYGRWDCDGMAATEREAATSWLSDPGRMYRFDERKLSVSEHLVRRRSLDSFALSPQLIKIHTQGSELRVVEGAVQTIQGHWPALMCAFPTAALTQFLAELGYRPFAYKGSSFLPGVTRPPVTFTWYLTEQNARHRSLMKSA
jgi:FkbM family methyltransferase